MPRASCHGQAVLRSLIAALFAHRRDGEQRQQDGEAEDDEDEIEHGIWSDDVNGPSQ